MPPDALIACMYERTVSRSTDESIGPVMSKKPPIVIEPPPTPCEPPAEPPGLPAVVAPAAAPGVPAAWADPPCSPATWPCWATRAEPGWPRARTVITPRTAANTTAAPRRETATRSRRPRETTGNPPCRPAWRRVSYQADTREYPQILEFIGCKPNKSRIRACCQYPSDAGAGAPSPSFGRRQAQWDDLAAPGLEVVKLLVGSPEKGHEVVVPPQLGNAEAEPHASLGRRPLDGRQLLASSPGRRVRQHADELVPAVAEHHVLGAQAVAQELGERLQQPVAGGVPILVVGLFQAVHVEEGDGQRAAVAPGRRYGALRGGDSGGSPEHARQLVERRLLPQAEQSGRAD